MDLFGFIRKAEDSRYRNRGSLSYIGDDNERFLAELFNLRLTDGRERGCGFPDLAGKKPYSGIQYYVEAKSAVGHASMNGYVGQGKSKWVIYASQTCLDDVVRSHMQRTHNGQELLGLYQDWNVQQPEDARVYYVFVKRVGERGYHPEKSPLGMFCFQYADIYMLRCDLVKPIFILKFLTRYKDKINSLGDEEVRVQEVLKILGMINEGRARGAQHRMLMNELKQNYQRGKIAIDPELFGIQSKKKGGLRGWDSVLESELESLVQKGGVWERLERIPGVRRNDYDCRSFEGVAGYSFWFVDHDDACRTPFSDALEMNRERITNIAKIRWILSHTSFIPSPPKNSVYISKKTSEAIWRFLIERYGHGIFDELVYWNLDGVDAGHMLLDIQGMIQEQSMQMELFENERRK